MAEKRTDSSELTKTMIESFLLMTVAGRGSVVYMDIDEETEQQPEAVDPEEAKRQMAVDLLLTLRVGDPMTQMKAYMISILLTSSDEQKGALSREASVYAVENGITFEDVVPIWTEFQATVGIKEAGEVDETQRTAWERLNAVAPSDGR